MSMQEIAVALRRVEAVLERRPDMGLHDDASATARWEGGTRMHIGHPAGRHVTTDMPTEMGGRGDQVTPGWLLRAGFASCASTCIAMEAARVDVALDALEVHVTSRSDSCGLLGMPDARGMPAYPGPQDLRMVVRIAAHGVSDDALRTLVEESYRRSPMTRAIEDAIPVSLQIEIDRGTLRAPSVDTDAVPDAALYAG